LVSLAGTNVYLLQGVLAVVLLVELGFILLVGLKGWRKYVITWLSLALMILHYSVIYTISLYAKVAILPLIVVEHDSYGGSLYVDYGQLAVLTLLLVWKKEISKTLGNLTARLGLRGGGVEGSQAGGAGEGKSEGEGEQVHG
jgi:hypothetical protein